MEFAEKPKRGDNAGSRQRGLFSNWTLFFVLLMILLTVAGVIVSLGVGSALHGSVIASNTTPEVEPSRVMYGVPFMEQPLVFYTNRSNLIYTLAPDENRVGQIMLPDEFYQVQSVEVSYDGRYIAFLAVMEDWERELWVIETFSGRMHHLTSSEEFGTLYDLTWRYDNNALFVCDYVPGNIPNNWVLREFSMTSETVAHHYYSDCDDPEEIGEFLPAVVGWSLDWVEYDVGDWSIRFDHTTFDLSVSDDSETLYIIPQVSDVSVYFPPE